MIRSRLVSFLNKHFYIQIIVCLLPLIFIGVYAIAYSFDMINVFSVLEYNNKVTMQDMNADSIKEVSYFKDNGDDTYNVIIEGEQSYEENISLGDTIYTVTLVNDNWFMLLTNSYNRLYITDTELFDVEALDNGTYNVIVDDNNSFNVESNDVVCSVILNDEGSYEADFIDDEIEPVIYDSLSTLQVELRDGDSYRISINSAYEKTFDNIDVKFCTNLPTSNIYYNESSQTFIKNASEGFSTNFIIGSNIGVVMISMTLYCILLGIIQKEGDLIILKKKGILMVNICAITILFLLIVLTKLLF